MSVGSDVIARESLRLPSPVASDPGWQALERSVRSGEPCGAIVAGGHFLPLMVAGGTFGEATSAARQFIPWLVTAAAVGGSTVPELQRPALDYFAKTWVDVARDLERYDLSTFGSGDPAARDAFFEAAKVVDREVDLIAQDEAYATLAYYMRQNCEPLLRALAIWDDYDDAASPEPKRTKPAAALSFATAAQLADALGCSRSYNTQASPEGTTGILESGFCHGRYGAVAIHILRRPADTQVLADRASAQACQTTTREPFVQGENWLVLPEGQTDGTMVRFTETRLGGNIVRPTCDGTPTTMASRVVTGSDCSLNRDSRRYVFTLYGMPPCDESVELFRRYLTDPRSMGTGWTCATAGTGRWTCEGARRDLTFSVQIVS